MVQAALAAGTAHRRSVFELFARRLPDGRRYGVVAGTGRLLDAIADFRFGEEQLAFLHDNDVVDVATLAWLADYQFSGTITGYAEGEIYVPGSPVVVVEASFAEGVILETLALSILNHDSAIAAAASRMTSAAGDRPCIEMGSRRTHEQAAVAAARAAYVAGFTATSNLAAGQLYGVPTAGTAAHSFTLLHDTERAAFQAQVASLGPDTTLLVDTYDIAVGVRTAVEVAGAGLGAVRIDSGDLLANAHAVRAQLDSLGAHDTRIVVTSDLDEFAISGLRSVPVDSYGVGTSLVTGSGAPTAGMVYKLVAHEDQHGDLIGVAKKSKDKASVAGRKYATRQMSADGQAQAEVIGIGTRSADDGDDRYLMVDLIVDGSRVYERGLGAAREQHAISRAQLPGAATQLSRGEPVIPTVYEQQP